MNPNVEKVEVNHIIQLTNENHKGWIACLLVVSEVRGWGVLAYNQMPMQGAAYLRVAYEDFEIVGRAVMVQPDSEQVENE
jgi:hypothetical protein